MTAARLSRRSRAAPGRKAALPGQVVLVLQGGGALGAYQVGVYQALHDAGIEPDWVIGTSIGAINAALICGNPPAHRLDRLNAFWDRIEQKRFGAERARSARPRGDARHHDHRAARHPVVLHAQPRSRCAAPAPRQASRTPSYYSTAPLRETLSELVDWPYLCECRTRLTVGAVNVCSGAMRYFDTPRGAARRRARDGVGRAAAGLRRRAHRRRAVLGRRHLLEHADRGGARRQAAPRFADLRGQRLAPDGERAELDLRGDGAHQGHPVREPRRQPHRAAEADPSPAPRHPRAGQAAAGRAGARPPAVQELASWGCGTQMHVAHLLAPRLASEDHTKDIDFTPRGIRRAARGRPCRRDADDRAGAVAARRSIRSKA